MHTSATQRQKDVEKLFSMTCPESGLGGTELRKDSYIKTIKVMRVATGECEDT